VRRDERDIGYRVTHSVSANCSSVRGCRGRHVGIRDRIGLLQALSGEEHEALGWADGVLGARREGQV
jgi:hypothetical protein